MSRDFTKMVQADVEQILQVGHGWVQVLSPMHTSHLDWAQAQAFVS